MFSPNLPQPRKVAASTVAAFAGLSIAPSILYCAVLMGILLAALLCIADAAPVAPKPAQPKLQRPYGMPPLMWRDYIYACYKAGISPGRITQTIGRAAASAGTHYRDGTLPENGAAYDYCAAIDLRSRDLNDTQRRTLLARLSESGFAGWYRNRGSFANNRHFHVIYTRYHMKLALRNQIHDWMQDKTGLVGHAKETFWNATPAQKQRARVLFLIANPARN